MQTALSCFRIKNALFLLKKDAPPVRRADMLPGKKNGRSKCGRQTSETAVYFGRTVNPLAHSGCQMFKYCELNTTVATNASTVIAAITV